MAHYDDSPLPIEYLPDSIKELLNTLSIASVLALIKAYRGTRVIVPKTPDAEHPLSVLIGLDELTKLCYVYGGSVFYCPQCIKALNFVRDSAILADKRTGLTLSEVARKYRLSEVGVSMALRRIEKHEYLHNTVQHKQVDWLSL
jgi:hypothetical protein